jgi:hypothetical protein
VSRVLGRERGRVVMRWILRLKFVSVDASRVERVKALLALKGRYTSAYGATRGDWDSRQGMAHQNHL